MDKERHEFKTPKVTELHRRFDFDAFDKLIGDVIDDAVVIDLNANVVELHPDLPDDAA